MHESEKWKWSRSALSFLPTLAQITTEGNLWYSKDTGEGISHNANPGMTHWKLSENNLALSIQYEIYIVFFFFFLDFFF